MSTQPRRQATSTTSPSSIAEATGRSPSTVSRSMGSRLACPLRVSSSTGEPLVPGFAELLADSSRSQWNDSHLHAGFRCLFHLRCCVERVRCLGRAHAVPLRHERHPLAFLRRRLLRCACCRLLLRVSSRARSTLLQLADSRALQHNRRGELAMLWSRLRRERGHVGQHLHHRSRLLAARLLGLPLQRGAFR